MVPNGTLKIVIIKLTLETRTRVPGVSYAVDSQSVCERKDGGIFSGSDGMHQWRQFGMPVSICLFLGNLSGKSNNKNSQTSDIQDLYSEERLFTFGDAETK